MTHVLLTGGARSGKSSLAVALAARDGAHVVFLATGQPGDDEMAARIARHRAERPPQWSTAEEPVRLVEAIGAVEPSACLIVDCLSLWVANLLDSEEAAGIERAAAAAADVAATRPGTTIVVTNKIKLKIIPTTHLNHKYHNLLNHINTI